MAASFRHPARALALHGAGWLLALSLAFAQSPEAQPPGGAPVPSASAAEHLLFLQDHLAGSRRPGELRYRYLEDAQGQAQVTDRAVLTLYADTGGRCCEVRGEYLSGVRAVNLPDIPDAHANPVLLYFLEGEVRRLQRTTNGQAGHFRRQIRQALADVASVEDTTLRWGDRTVPARRVRVVPFLNDPYRARFADQADTEYIFLFADAVPGGLYEAAALLPATAAGTPALARRTLTIEEAKP